MKKAVLLFVAAGLSISVMAEFRIWTDLNGNQTEAEFIRVSGKNIVLKKREGKQLTFSPMVLSAEDQEYLWGKIPEDLLNPTKSVIDRIEPPRMEVKVTKNTETKKDWDRVDRKLSCIVKIKKTSSPEYTGKLKAALCVVGIEKRDDCYVMIDKEEFDFDFIESNKVELEGNTVRITYYQSHDYGIEYKGYVVVITDEEGNALHVCGSSNKFEEAGDKLLKLNRRDAFSKSFKKIDSRYSGSWLQ